ncbi:MAG: histidine--tRNA ligase [Bdellovibrionia bacterium]
MSKLQRVRGTRDMMPDENLAFRFVEGLAYNNASKFGFGEIETPVFEFSEVFHRTLGETSDVVHKETYTFVDRSGDSLTLRPEGTAGIARSFISEGLAQNIPLKLYYSGPMFRHERPQKGRYRQFNQIGVEVLGLETPMADVEVINLAWNILGDLGLHQKCKLEINTLGDAASRNSYRDVLVEFFSKHKEQLSEDSRMRLEKNPLRILDSKDEGDRKLIAQAPEAKNYLTPEAQDFFARVLKGLDALGIPYEINPRLVRGLDYYCHSVFEFTTTELGAQGTLLAGGRYDSLIESMGGPKTAGVGWAAGIERLCEMLAPEKWQPSPGKIAIIGADERGEIESHKLANELRQQNLPIENILSGNVGKKMKKANKSQCTWAIIIGSAEIDQNQVTIKNLVSGEQEIVPRGDLAKKLT